LPSQTPLLLHSLLTAHQARMMTKSESAPMRLLALYSI